MATQQQIQSLLQSLTGLQSNVQNSQQFTVNNGNPGTIYNLSAPNVRMFNPATGNLPAMGDASGNWAVPANGIDPNLLTLLTNLTVGRTPLNPTIPPLQLNPVLPPNPGNPNTGTPEPDRRPTTDTDIRAILNDLGAYGTGGIGGGAGPGGLYGIGTNMNFGSSVGGQQGGSNSSGFYSPATGVWGVSPGLANQLGFNADGSMDWQQMLDLILPGNVYNSQTNKWNTGNIIGSIAEQLLGLPGISNIINKIGEKQTTDDNPNNDNSWFAQQFLGNVTNRAQGLINQTQAQMQNQFANRNNPIMKETLNKIAEDQAAAETARLEAEARAKADQAIRDATAGLTGGDKGGGGGRGISGRASANSMFLGRGSGGAGSGRVTVGEPTKVVKAAQ